MLVHFGTDLLPAPWSGAVVCVGTFDGVHLGHQALLQKTVLTARDMRVPAVVLTFDRHPAATLAPERTPPSIATLAQNLRHIAQAGISVAIVLPFDNSISQTSAQDFLDQILLAKLHTRRLVIGHDFALGRQREGNAPWLAAQLPTETLPPVEVEGVRVSSSAIRSAIALGDLSTATNLLGHPFAIQSVVVSGQQLGRQLGYPTLNLALDPRQLLPADGVYAGQCQTPIGLFPAAISIGYRPAVHGKHRTVEAFLLDYPGLEIYGAPVELAFQQRLREELPFPDLEALKAQMARDVAQTAQIVTLSPPTAANTQTPSYVT